MSFKTGIWSHTCSCFVQYSADLVYVIGDINIHSGILHTDKVYKQMHISILFFLPDTHKNTHTNTHKFQIAT